MQTTGSAEVLIVVWSRYITSRYITVKTLENDIIKGPLFYNFHQTFHKNFAIL